MRNSLLISVAVTFFNLSYAQVWDVNVYDGRGDVFAECTWIIYDDSRDDIGKVICQKQNGVSIRFESKITLYENNEEEFGIIYEGPYPYNDDMLGICTFAHFNKHQPGQRYSYECIGDYIYESLSWDATARDSSPSALKSHSF